MPKIPNDVLDNDVFYPKRQVHCPTIHIGIDPGQAGGLVALFSSGKIEYTLMPSSERDIWEWFQQLPEGPRYAILEEITPRPTFFKGKSSILRSTCLIYGHYRMLKGMVIAASIPFSEARPQEWMKALSIPTGKNKEVTENKWKDYLRGRAQQLYPALPLWSEKKAKGKQLAVADAILIAEFCKRKQEGKL